ncbi:helix-turn-helix transcriptional regulator [Vreelandella titanicae]|jgi:DNA-binding CsgD family transcriptional regulator|uniref:helix-turn-helix transcriptional regulator n=2 Tax=Oceanospirillales TaxID=135619 RepID=UPI003BF48037
MVDSCSRLGLMLKSYLMNFGEDRYSLLTIRNGMEIDLETSLPEEWKTEFLNRKMYIKSDIVKEAKHHITPFKWSPEEYYDSDITYLTKTYNISLGISFSINTWNSKTILTIYTNNSESQFNKNFDDMTKLHLYNLLSIFEKNQETPDYKELTLRELEVANLLKFGKTYNEISIILDLSERTVRFHTNNIVEKMNVYTVKHALFKATSMGLI